jgi:hypothetical protein
MACSSRDRALEALVKSSSTLTSYSRNPFDFGECQGLIFRASLTSVAGRYFSKSQRRFDAL